MFLVDGLAVWNILGSTKLDGASISEGSAKDYVPPMIGTWTTSISDSPTQLRIFFKKISMGPIQLGIKKEKKY